MPSKHYCMKEKELSEMYTVLMRIDKRLNGNGQIGLLDEWQRLKGSIKTLQYITGFLGVSGILAIIKLILIR